MSIDVVFDMETGDPDDFFTLCLLTAHPKVNLRAVTVTPVLANKLVSCVMHCNIQNMITSL